jgi:NAD(P)-dependent dehydrogenase (short-subunit alcohol dehydrogenase family)
MAERAAIVTGASSGIGKAIAEMLASEGYGLTIASRRADKIEAAADALQAAGAEVEHLPANMASEEDIKAVVERHRARYGRLDVLVNNAGVGMGAPVGEISTKRLDAQLDVNIRSIVLFYRECVSMLREAGAEHGDALVVNTASVAGKRGQGWLSVYSATKFAVVGFTEAMNKELSNEGIKSCALCPGFVDTAMTDFIKESVEPSSMIQPTDIAEAVRYLLKTSPGCLIPEIVFNRPGETI